MRCWVPSSLPAPAAFTVIWEHSPSISTVVFNCIVLFPLHIFLFNSDTFIREKPAQSKALASLGARSRLGAGLRCPSGIWVALDGAGAASVLVASATRRGSDQPPGLSIRSLEFEWFISRPSGVWSSVLHQAPAYRGSDMASLSKCLALLDSGWVLYWLLTLNKHLVFITNGSRPERGAVLGGAVT